MISMPTIVKNNSKEKKGVKATPIEDKQQKLMQFQFLQQAHQQIQQQAQQLSQKIAELAAARQSLEDFEKVKPSDALIPVGGGNYISGKISNSDEVLVTFGAGIAVKKTRAEAVRITEARLSELQKIGAEMSSQQNLINLQLQSLQQELQKSE